MVLAMPTLFRKEVLEAQRQRLHGDVLIVTPLPLAVITGWLLVTLLGLGALAVFGTYARSERVQGYLVPSGGLVKVAPARAGVLREVRVQVREEVAAGQVLAVVRSEAPLLAGDTAASIALESLRDQERLLEGQIRLEGDRLTRERSRLEAEGDGLEAQIASFEEQRELQREITETARSAFTRATALLEAGFVSVVESETRKRGSGQEPVRNLVVVSAKAQNWIIILTTRRSRPAATTAMATAANGCSRTMADWICRFPGTGRVDSIRS